jgi:hypothetical protein
VRGVVRCDHCGAPHRRDGASTRFRCDWCGGDNRVEAQCLVEELLFAADDHSRDPATRVRDALGSRGLAETSIRPGPLRWVGLWQVVNEQGEEFLACTGRRTDAPPLKGLPTGPLVGIGEQPPGWVSSLPERPVPEHDPETIVDAARAEFEQDEAAVTLIRLVWIGVAEFLLDFRGHSFGALQILGTDRVQFEGLPEAGSMQAVVPERLLAWTVYAIGALALGLLVSEPGPRLAFELGWFGLAGAVWLVRSHRTAGVPR